MFLDRDGTLMQEVEYCGDPRKVCLLPGVATALRQLKDLQFRLIIVTNQSGIGRGLYSEADFSRVQAEFMRQLGSPGLIDATYHCPDAPGCATERRKPGTGMILEAMRALNLDLSCSYIVGDTSADILCGQRAGFAGSVLVLTGHGRKQGGKCQPDHTAEDLAGAADWIVQQAFVQS